MTIFLHQLSVIPVYIIPTFDVGGTFTDVGKLFTNIKITMCDYGTLSLLRRQMLYPVELLRLIT